MSSAVDQILAAAWNRNEHGDAYFLLDEPDLYLSVRHDQFRRVWRWYVSRDAGAAWELSGSSASGDQAKAAAAEACVARLTGHQRLDLLRRLRAG